MSDATPPEGAIRIVREDQLFLIGIDRVAKYNGFSPEMVEQLAEAFDQFEKDADARVAVLHAHGPHFTAGVQLDRISAWFAEGKHLGVAGKIDPYDLRAPRRTKPVVAAVQGFCYTVAIELMLAADIVIAASDARFGQVEVRRGIFANHGATLRMVERAGWGNAMRYLLTGDDFDAATAYRLGFVQEIVEPGQQLARAKEVALRIAQQAPLAVQQTLHSARTAVMEGWDAAIADLGPAQARLSATEDGREGLQSFREKRDGRFTGR